MRKIRKTGRRAALAVLAVCVTLLLASCGGPGPSEVCGDTLEAIRSQDAKSIASSYEGTEESVAPDAEGAAALGDLTGSDSTLTDDQKDVLRTLVDKALDFRYEIGEESVDGDEAVVTVTFRTYDFEALDENVRRDAEDAIASEAASDALTEENLESRVTELFYQEMKEELDGMTKRTRKKTVKLKLRKTKDGWKVRPLSDKARDAMFGGLTSLSD